MWSTIGGFFAKIGAWIADKFVFKWLVERSMKAENNETAKELQKDYAQNVVNFPRGNSADRLRSGDF